MHQQACIHIRDWSIRLQLSSLRIKRHLSEICIVTQRHLDVLILLPKDFRVLLLILLSVLLTY